MGPLFISLLSQLSKTPLLLIESSFQSDKDKTEIAGFPFGLFFVHLADYLEEILGVKVDLITPEAIKPNRRRYILEELIYV